MCANMCAMLTLSFQINNQEMGWCQQGCPTMVDTGTTQITLPAQPFNYLMQAIRAQSFNGQVTYFSCLSVCLSVYLSVCLSVSVLSPWLSLSLCLCLSVCLFFSICLSVSFSLSLFFCLSVYLCLSRYLCLSLSLSLSLSL